jgi:hypothetical protein
VKKTNEIGTARRVLSWECFEVWINVVIIYFSTAHNTCFDDKCVKYS